MRRSSSCHYPGGTCRIAVRGKLLNQKQSLSLYRVGMYRILWLHAISKQTLFVPFWVLLSKRPSLAHCYDMQTQMALFSVYHVHWRLVNGKCLKTKDQKKYFPFTSKPLTTTASQYSQHCIYFISLARPALVLGWWSVYKAQIGLLDLAAELRQTTLEFLFIQCLSDFVTIGLIAFCDCLANSRFHCYCYNAYQIMWLIGFCYYLILVPW